MILPIVTEKISAVRIIRPISLNTVLDRILIIGLRRLLILRTRHCATNHTANDATNNAAGKTASTTAIPTMPTTAATATLRHSRVRPSYKQHGEDYKCSHFPLQ